MNLLFLLNTTFELKYLFEFFATGIIISSLVLVLSIYKKNKVFASFGTFVFFLLTSFIFVTIISIYGSISFYKGEINGYPSYTQFNTKAFLYQYGFFSLIFLIAITALFRKNFLAVLGVSETNYKNTTKIQNKEHLKEHRPDDISMDNIVQNTTEKKSNLQEVMSSDNPIPKDSPKFTTILYITLGVCTIGIVLFLWSARNQTEYSTTNSQSLENQENETTLNTPKYIGVDKYIQDMNSGNTQIYSVADRPKAFGANWQMRIPISFNIIPGDKEHVISKFGTKDFNPDITIGIGAHKLNIADDIHLTKDDIDYLFDDPSFISDIVQEKGKFISGKKIVIDGENPGYMSEIEYNFTNIDNSIKMRSLIFMFIVNKVIFTVSCNVNVATQDPDENLKDKMDQHRGFYKLIANTIIINENETSDNQFISEHSFSEGIVNRDNVNLRTVPELSSHIVDLVNTGEEFYIIEKSEEETTIPNLGTHYWYLVENDNYKGWIFGKFLDMK